MSDEIDRNNLNFYQELAEDNKSKVVLMVLDGLGGLPLESGGKTELEIAHTPRMDALACESICGLHSPVGPGIIPGSGPAHLGLFGYDPVKYQVGRGVLSALGIGFDLREGDVAARGNFCTVDEKGIITDRRAGRISSEKNRELCKLLRKIEIPGISIHIETVKEYRFLFVMGGKNLSGEVSATDPQNVGEKPLDPIPENEEAKYTAELIKKFIDKARNVLADHSPANMILLRGFSKRPQWPDFEDTFKVRAVAIAAYPMYRGVAKLVGMNALESGDTLDEEFSILEKNWLNYDFFFIHVKKIDSYGEDGKDKDKIRLIEEVDTYIPRLLKLKPDVLIVTGDHSTPSVLKSHSWHPVPVMIRSKYSRVDTVSEFGERACMYGGLGPRIPSHHLMPIAMANAGRLEKFGA